MDRRTVQLIETVSALGIGASVLLGAVFGVVDVISHDETSPILWRVCFGTAVALFFFRSVFQRWQDPP